MLCLECGAEMSLVQVVKDTTNITVSVCWRCGVSSHPAAPVRREGA
jgi:transcription elongation factor Elf1